MSHPRVACIVLNYNGKEITLQALASLSRMTYPAFDLIHVDNGSADGSYEAVAEALPEVVQVRIEENRGPTIGLNRGLEAGLAGDYEYLMLLNNDIEVDPEMLTEMVRLAETDPAIGCVGPKAFYYWDRERIWSAGGIIRFKESVTKERGNKALDHGQFDEDVEVDYLNGCAILMRRSVVEEVGMWDPIFNLAVEDADWCMRAKQRGYRCMYAHRAILYHMVATSAGGYVARRTFYTGRANAIFVRRYGGWYEWLTFVAFSVAGLPLAFLRELPKRNHGAALAKLRGIFAGLREPMTAPPKVGDPV